MNTEIEQILEFDKIKSEIAKYCTSGLGKSLVERLKPITDIQDIQRLLNIISEMRNIHITDGTLPLGGLYDIRMLLRKAEVSDSVLETDELLIIASTAGVARKVKGFARDFSEKYPLLYEIIQDISVFTNLEEAIYGCIDHEGNILDTASPELFRIRRAIVLLRDKITRQLESILRSPHYQTAIQDNLITIRNDRYVIPIKQSEKSSFPGVLQGRSASGVTAFIEPISVVDMNNQLHELKNEELAEIRRILKDLTDKVRNVLSELDRTVKILAELDFINAKALFCTKLNAVKPQINNIGYIEIQKARHPILQMKLDKQAENKAIENDNAPQKIVPIDFHIGKEFDTIVITGPNTGGKTVALKTVGLLTLMMQSGLHVPVKEGSQMAVFNEVFADIGDEQSIEQNLSTFSSHITRIIRIIEQLDDSSLVLLDELGAGTEPSEGAALGMAILDYLHSRGVRTVATTHHDSLKAHAYTKEGMENASVAFDLKTLQPTYELRIGMPGSSNALKIADRLGLSKEILANAKNYLEPGSVQVSDLITNVEKMQRELEKQRKMAEEKTIKAEKIQHLHEQLIQQIKSKRKDIEREALNEAEKIIQNAKRLVENTIAEIQKEKASTESIRRTQKSLAKAKEEIALAVKQISNETPEESEIYMNDEELSAEDIKPGNEVYIKSLNLSGTIMTKPDSKGIVLVISGGAKISVPFTELRLFCQKPKQIKQEQAISLPVKSGISEILDLRGYRIAEAIEKADKHLDDAALAGLKFVSIIHGKGTGALRKAVTEMLSEHPHVANFRLGQQNEGGQGITIVELRS